MTTFKKPIWFWVTGALAALRGKYHAYISPSTFLLDEQGRNLLEVASAIKGRTPSISDANLVEEIIASQYAGLRDNEFCPLDQAWWSEGVELVCRLESRYDEYRRKVVMPLFSTLTSCDGLIVLVDIAGILASGPKQLNDAHEFAEHLLKALKPSGTIPQWLMRKCGLRRRIRRIALAASQCDRFHPDDWPMLEVLVRWIAERPVANVDGVVKADYFACSAVRSTSEVNGGKLRGVLQCNNQACIEPKEYQVSRIPEKWADLPDWPSSWNPEDFRSLPAILPQMPAVFRAVPDQVGLARIFGFVTGWFRHATD